MPKEIPSESMVKAIELWKEGNGLSFSKIARQLGISRQTVSGICQGERTAKEEPDEYRVGQITGQVKGKLDSAKQTVGDAFQSCSEAVKDPLLSAWAKETAWGFGFVDANDYRAWRAAADEQKKQLQNQVASLGERLSHLSGVLSEAQEENQKSRAELEDLRKIKTAFDKLTRDLVGEGKIAPYLAGIDEGKKQILESFATHKDEIFQSWLREKNPLLAKLQEINKPNPMENMMQFMLMNKLLQ